MLRQIPMQPCIPPPKTLLASKPNTSFKALTWNCISIIFKQPGQLALHALASRRPKLPSHAVSGMPSA